MTEHLAIEIAHARMREQNITDYILRYRHLVIQPLTKKVMNAENETLLFISPPNYVKVSSASGLFDLVGVEITEMQYIHTGKVTIENTSTTLRAFVALLQIITPVVNSFIQ